MDFTYSYRYILANSVHVADKAPTYGELIDILNYAEIECMDISTVQGIYVQKLRKHITISGLHVHNNFMTLLRTLLLQ